MFSVVIPVFNHAPFVSAGVRSALASSLVTEILVADDGSTDNSCEIIEHLVTIYPGRVRWLSTPPGENLGAHVRLNELCEAASNSWISILNSDDQFVPGRFEVLRSFIRAKSVDLIAGSLLIINDAGQVIGVKRGLGHPEYDHPFGRSNELDYSNLLAFLCNQNFIATTSNIVFSKRIFHQVGGFSHFRYVHDWDFVIRAATIGKVYFTQCFLTRYRTHGSNTIREKNSHVDGETTRLFARFLSDYPWVEGDTLCRLGLQNNQHLDTRILLDCFPGFQLPANLPAPRQKPARRLPHFPSVSSTSYDTTPVAQRVVFSTGDSEYEYRPEVPQALPEQTFPNILLCLAHFPYDFLIISESLNDTPTISIHTLRDNAVFNQRASKLIIDGVVPCRPLIGRIIRYARANTPIGYCDLDLRRLPGFENARIAGPEVRFNMDHGVPVASQAKTIDSLVNLIEDDHARPLCWVLPMFLAVGGVERNTIEVMRNLIDRYRFLVITTERLVKDQGSLHYQLEELGIPFFDLAEIAEPQCHLILLGSLRAMFPPNLIWICNGSPWLVENAAYLRRMFANIPIIDQQVYDTEHGWIKHFNRRGIQSFDYFIAINKRIQNKFLHELRIVRDRVALIYPLINSESLSRRRRDVVARMEIRERYGIREDQKVFGFIGRLTAQKRPGDFLSLAKRAKDSGLTDLFLLVGNGELGQEIERTIRRDRLDNVIRVSFVDDISEVIEVMDGLVIVSMFEGLPIALLETLALGKPALATDVGDIRLVLEEYGNGMVIPKIGDAEVLWHSFLAWRGCLSELQNIAKLKGDEILNRFSAKRISEEYDSLWTTALAEMRSETRSSI